MYTEKNSKKHYTPAGERLSMMPASIRRWKRLSLIVCGVALLGSIAAGVTLAYVSTRTESVKNVFAESKVACSVVENGTDGATEFDGKVKTNVKIKNTGDTTAYIRAAVVVTWMSTDETKVTVTAAKPVDGTDYEIVYADEYAAATTNWILGADGYWYYTLPVDPATSDNDPNSLTDILIHSCSLKKGAAVPSGFYLSVEIVASAIQAAPTTVVTEQWSSGVSGVNGTTLTIKTTTTN